jgi:hypothetical protein
LEQQDEVDKLSGYRKPYVHPEIADTERPSLFPNPETPVSFKRCEEKKKKKKRRARMLCNRLVAKEELRTPSRR